MDERKEGARHKISIAVIVVLSITLLFLIISNLSKDEKMTFLDDEYKPECVYTTEDYEGDALKVNSWLTYLICKAQEAQDYRVCLEVPQELDDLVFTHCDFSRILSETQKECVYLYVEGLMTKEIDTKSCEVVKKDYPEIYSNCVEMVETVHKQGINTESIDEKKAEEFCIEIVENQSHVPGCMSGILNDCSYRIDPRYKIICQILYEEATNCEQYIVN